MQRRILLITAIVGLGGCEPEAQLLPFEAASGTARVVTEDGGTVSYAAGAAIHFPQGSLVGAEDIQIASLAAPVEIASTGAVASAAFRVGPDGLQLARPARLELKFDEDIDPSLAWLATLVGVSNGIVQPYGATRVDLSTRVAEGHVEDLGTFGVVIPSTGMVHPVQALSSGGGFSLAALSSVAVPTTVDSLTVFCGGSRTPCSAIRASASASLLDRVQAAALLYPSVAGGLRIENGRVIGSINASGSVRVQMRSGQTAETVHLEVTVEPTAATVVAETQSDVSFSNVRILSSGELMGGSEPHEEIGTLVVTKTEQGGVISVGRSFRLIGEENGSETARVSIEIPVRLYH